MAIDFGKMIGPLPLGAWVVIVGGGLGYGYYEYSKGNTGSSSSSSSTPDLSSNNGVGTGGSGMYWQDVNPLDNPTSSSSQSPTDNTSWGQQVENYLIARGFNPSTVDNAVNQYLYGTTKLNSELSSLIGLGIAQYGAPPQPINSSLQPNPTPTPPAHHPPVHKKKVPSPPPKKTPPPKKPTHRKPQTTYYTVKKGDTLWGIAQHYYKNGNDWRTLYNANRSQIRNPNLIYPGQKLKVPAH